MLIEPSPPRQRGARASRNCPGDSRLASPTDTPNKEGNFRGQRQSQRDALARGREVKRVRSRHGRIRAKQVGGLQGEASLAISGRLRRFIEAYDDDHEVLGKVAIGQLLADLWDANSFLRPIWVTVRRLVTRINNADRKASGKNGDALKEDLKTLESLDSLVPLMDQLGRWHKRTTDVALRLGELSVRLKMAGGGGKGYLEERYGDGGDGASTGEEEDEVPPETEEAEILEESPAEPVESPHEATSKDALPPPAEPAPGPPPA